MAKKLSTTSYAMLGLLTFGEMSGYDVLKLAERSVGHFWSPAKSHVYSELRRLAELGYATETPVHQDRRPDKRLYAITEEGRTALRSWLEEGEVIPDQVRSEFTLRVFFGDLVSSELLATQVGEVKSRAEKTLAELRQTEEQIKDQEQLLFPYLTLKSGLAHCEAEIRWADEVLEELERRRDG